MQDPGQAETGEVLTAGSTHTAAPDPEIVKKTGSIRRPEKIRNEELWERAGQEQVAKQILRKKGLEKRRTRNRVGGLRLAGRFCFVQQLKFRQRS
nr:hypothetical protein BaRGS_025200 [Batillaria attramentaria]